MDQSTSQTDAQQYCISSAGEIARLLRTYSRHVGLRYSPIVSIYATTQALRASKLLGVAEGREFLSHVLVECSQTWELSEQLRVGHQD